MKTNPFKLMTAVVMGAVLMMAFQCGKDEDPEPLNPNCNAHHSECLSHTDRDTNDYIHGAIKSNMEYTPQERLNNQNNHRQ